MDGHSLCGTQTFCLRGDNSRSHLLKNMEPKRKINESWAATFWIEEWFRQWGTDKRTGTPSLSCQRQLFVVRGLFLDNRPRLEAQIIIRSERHRTVLSLILPHWSLTRPSGRLGRPRLVTVTGTVIPFHYAHPPRPSYARSSWQSI